MSKIRINLANGSVVEKPLVTCFKGTNGDYIILDNETNGSMGLPIICVSKINNNQVEKIFDQGEWAAVKENLKTIIAGTALPYLKVSENLTAQDDFYTQLTLPLASFDLLKNSYMPPVEVAPAETPSVTVEQPVENFSLPTEPEVTIPEPITFTNPEVIAPVMPTETNVATPSVDIPVMEPASIAPVMPEVAPVEPNIPQIDPVMPNNDFTNPEPVIKPEVPVMPTETNMNNVNLEEIKETFMKSCETMFDALVKKFENK